MMPTLFNWNSKLRNRLQIVIALVMLLSTSIDLPAEPEELKPEYAELMTVIEMEKTLFERMQADLSEKNLAAEITLRIEEIKQAYRDYLDKYPRNVFAHIIYGKFLRKANQPELANDVFLDIHEDNPDIAVVNQHLALHASETGRFSEAFRFFQRALELEPHAALTHYQFGEFLFTYKMLLVRQQLLSLSEVETLMQSSFRKAHELAPDNRDFHIRWAESFFDAFQPDWHTVLPEWTHLIETSTQLFEKDVLLLQKARVLIELSRYYDARQLIDEVDDPVLNASKKELLERIP